MKRAAKSAGKIVVLENDGPISMETEQIQARIRERAYELSQQRGHSGRELDDWVTAESEIVSVPPAEMIEKDGVIQMRFALPGIEPADLNIMATPGQMLLKCESHHDHQAEGGTVHLCDFKAATVFRSVRFPEAIDVNSIATEFGDGILQVRAVKQKAQPSAMKRAPARKSAPKRSSKAARGA